MEQAFAQASAVEPEIMEQSSAARDAEEIKSDAGIVESAGDSQEDLDNPVEEPSGETDESDSDKNT